MNAFRKNPHSPQALHKGITHNSQQCDDRHGVTCGSVETDKGKQRGRHTTFTQKQKGLKMQHKTQD